MNAKLFCFGLGFLIGAILIIVIWVIAHELTKERDCDEELRRNYYEDIRKLGRAAADGMHNGMGTALERLTRDYERKQADLLMTNELKNILERMKKKDLDIVDTLQLPPADELKIIYCKDCIHFNDGDCTEMPKICSENDFCGWAEKREASK